MITRNVSAHGSRLASDGFPALQRFVQVLLQRRFQGCFLNAHVTQQGSAQSTQKVLLQSRFSFSTQIWHFCIQLTSRVLIISAKNKVVSGGD